MPDSIRSLIPSYTKRRRSNRDASADSSGSVTYMRGDAFTRPLDPPRSSRTMTIVLCSIAAVIGIIFLGIYLDDMINGPAREEEETQARLDAQVSYNLPILADYLQLDDASILASVQAIGDEVYDNTDEGTNGISLIKLPSGVSIESAAAMYLSGIDNLSPSNAALLLNGSWTLTTERSNGINIAIHYADFESENVELAVQTGMESQGFDAESVVESGVDESGNTFSSGNIDVNGTTYTWRVSAVALSAVYSVSGLPDSASYVGIRISG